MRGCENETSYAGHFEKGFGEVGRNRVCTFDGEGKRRVRPESVDVGMSAASIVEA